MIHLIFGDDVCNTYKGQIIINKDTIQIYRISKTLIGCQSVLQYFNACLLIGSWNIKRDTVLIFKSNFIDLASNKPFVNKKWYLSLSNDTSFAILQQYDLLFKLYLYGNREFSINWYYAPRNSIFNSNFVGGVLGITKNHLITYYQTRNNYAAPKIQGVTIGIRDLLLVNRMIRCDSFEFSDTTFTLIKHPKQLYYKFILTKTHSLTKKN